MILRALSSNQPHTLIFTPIAVVGLLLPMLLGHSFQTVDSGFPSGGWLESLHLNPLILNIVVIVLIVSGGILANRVFNKHEFLSIPVFTPAFVYAFTACGLSLIQLSVPALLANIFVLLGLNKHLSVYRQPAVLSFYFESAFWYGIAAVLFSPFIVLLPGMVIAILITRSFNWREVFVPIVVFCVPFLYWLAWFYIRGNHEDIILFNKIISWDSVLFFSLLSWPKRVFMLTVLATFIAALPRYIFPSERGSNKGESVKNVFMVMAVSTIGAFVVGYFLTFKWTLLSLTLPIAVVAGYWFSNYRTSLFAPFFFYAFCCATIILTVATYFF